MTPLLLIPGMMCDARLFAPQIAEFSGERAIHLAPISAHDSVEALTADILANAPHRFALAGLSMGGIVAMDILRQAPERVDRIALIDTNPKAELPDVASAREPQMEAVMDGRLREVMRDEMKPRYLADGPSKNTILNLCMDMALALGPDVFVRQSRALQGRRDQRDTLRAARLPALVLCGEGDVLCPIETHELMRDLLDGSTLEIVPGAGHLPTLEQSEATNAAISRWLEAI